jgi:citrate lyase subunit beta/citryl-CoA lyase
VTNADARELSTIRSWLFVPGDSERKLEKCWESGADALIFDLEDSVLDENKPAARTRIASCLAGNRARADAITCTIRINSLATGMAEQDVAETIIARPAAYVVPKVTSAADVADIAAILDQYESQAGIETGSTGIVPIATETPGAVFQLQQIAHAHPRVRALFWGMEDLATELGARATRRPSGELLDVFKTVRSLALLAGASAGIGIVDTPVIDLNDIDGFRAEAADAALMGFTGKLAIHPSQVGPINEAFTPEAASIAEAETILKLSSEGGGAAFRYNGRMVDTPHLAAARKLLARIRR